IMDIVYREGEATPRRVLERLPDPPTYSAVRALLRILERKGLVRHAAAGKSYVYRPSVPRTKTARPAVANLLTPSYDGSPEKAVAALRDLPRPALPGEDGDRLPRLIEQAREEGR